MAIPRFPFAGGPATYRTALAALKMAALGHVLLQHVASPGLPYGPSMLPRFEVSHECILVSHLHRHGRNVKVGDVVVYSIPTDAANNGVKRVLGLEGDYVLIETPRSPALSALADGSERDGGSSLHGGGQAMIQVSRNLLSTRSCRNGLVVYDTFERCSAVGLG